MKKCPLPWTHTEDVMKSTVLVVVENGENHEIALDVIGQCSRKSGGKFSCSVQQGSKNYLRELFYSRLASSRKTQFLRFEIRN